MAVKITVVENRQVMSGASGRSVLVLEFSDGSRLKVEMTKKHRDMYLWTKCRVLLDD